MEPDEGLRIPVIMRMVVVFPAPFTPRKANIPPDGISRETSLTATKDPYFFVTFLSVIIEPL
jgi:hypothetical protein